MYSLEFDFNLPTESVKSLTVKGVDQVWLGRAEVTLGAQVVTSVAGTWVVTASATTTGTWVVSALATTTGETWVVSASASTAHQWQRLARF